MTIKQIMDELQTKVEEAKQARNRLAEKFSEGEVLPDGFSNWGAVGYALTNLDDMVKDIENCLNDLCVWRNGAY